MEAKQAMSIVNFSMVKQETSRKEVVWLKLDPKNQIPHIKTLLKSRVFHQFNKRNDKDILEQCGSCDITHHEVLSYASGSVDYPMILQENDNNDNIAGGGSELLT